MNYNYQYAYQNALSNLRTNFGLRLPGDEAISHNYVYSESDYKFSFDPYDPKNTRSIANIQCFVNEMTNTVNGMVITEEEANRNLLLIIHDLKMTMKYLYDVRQLEWQCYGSYRNGLGCRSSDIDLYYPLNELEVKTVPRRIETVLISQSTLFEEVYFVEDAIVPIIKLVHKSTRKEVDISFCEIGVHSTKLMKLYCTFNDNLKILTLYLKYLLSKYTLQGPKKITTTILFWMVVYFMQQKKLLPSVLEVRKVAEKKHYVSGWDCSVPDACRYSSHDSGNLYFLLRDFFKFYRDFDFLKYVICPLVGRAFTIYDFKNLNIPEEEFSIYLNKVRNGQQEKNGFSTHFINIQHPILLGNNLAKQVDKRIVNYFKMLCYHAYNRLPDGCSPVTSSISLFLPIEGSKTSCIPNLKQFSFWCFDLRNLARGDHESTNFLSVIRRVMETALDFKVRTITTMNGDRKKVTTSVTFFEYFADSETWRNWNVSHIFDLLNKPENRQLYHKPMCVYIACEICTERKEVKIWLQSEDYLHTFLIEYFEKLLMSVLH